MLVLVFAGHGHELLAELVQFLFDLDLADAGIPESAGVPAL